jgi:DNA topoisomerase-1
VGLYSGRYGAYVKHGKVNATLPDQNAINTITLEEALELIAAKSGKKTKGKTAKAAPKAKVKRAA